MEIFHDRGGMSNATIHSAHDWLAWETSWRTAFAFLAATLLCGVLWSGRAAATGHFFFLYLPWNLFLAWLPLFFAIITRALFEQSGWSRKTFIAGTAWLLFLPNSPYIVTDLIHLRSHPPVPLWYDATLFAAFAFTGVALGFVSLRLIHDVVADQRGWMRGWIFTFGVLALCGFGIYLGRVERWNSWSVLTEPHVLIRDVGSIFGSWKSVCHTLGFSGVFFVFLSLCYVLLSGLTCWPAPATTKKLNSADC